MGSIKDMMNANNNAQVLAQIDQNIQQSQQQAQEEKPKASFWLNFGYMMGESFIQLSGIPLDTFGVGGNTKPTKKQLSVVSSFLKVAEKLPKGGRKELDLGGNFRIQLIHVGEQPTTSEEEQSLANIEEMFAD